jgi:nitroimidazol reductase NimA-like FMN-containing flavoprotein (pyridoxamine 5'-phosphate oxidase superfamily)
MTVQADDPDNTKEPKTELHPGFSADDATATPWAEARRSLELADLSWLTTVRPDGRPHVTPLIFVWLEGAVFFVTGPDERKAKNLTRNPHCIITTGCNTLEEGLDVVVEGEAALVSDPVRLQQVADGFAAKYVPREGVKTWHFALRDGAFIVDDSKTLLFEVRPTTAFGFGKGEFSQTRWRF